MKNASRRSFLGLTAASLAAIPALFGSRAVQASDASKGLPLTPEQLMELAKGDQIVPEAPDQLRRQMEYRVMHEYAREICANAATRGNPEKRDEFVHPKLSRLYFVEDDANSDNAYSYVWPRVSMANSLRHLLVDFEEVEVPGDQLAATGYPMGPIGFNTIGAFASLCGLNDGKSGLNGGMDAAYINACIRLEMLNAMGLGHKDEYSALKGRCSLEASYNIHARYWRLERQTQNVDRVHNLVSHKDSTTLRFIACPVRFRKNMFDGTCPVGKMAFVLTEPLRSAISFALFYLERESERARAIDKRFFSRIAYPQTCTHVFEDCVIYAPYVDISYVRLDGPEKDYSKESRAIAGVEPELYWFENGMTQAEYLGKKNATALAVRGEWPLKVQVPGCICTDCMTG